MAERVVLALLAIPPNVERAEAEAVARIQARVELAALVDNLVEAEVVEGEAQL